MRVRVPLQVLHARPRIVGCAASRAFRLKVRPIRVDTLAQRKWGRASGDHHDVPFHGRTLLNDEAESRSAQTQTLLRRAAALSVRAGALQRAQAQYEGQVARQVTAVARSAARFFDQLG
jgi:hypothetical protein